MQKCCPIPMSDFARFPHLKSNGERRKPENLPGRNPLGVWMLRLETISDLKFSWNKSLKLNCRWSCFFLQDGSAMRIKRHQQFDTIWRRDWVGLISKSGEIRSANPPTDDNRFSCLRNHERLYCRYFQIWRKHLSTSCHEHMKTLGDEVEATWAEIIDHHVFDLFFPWRFARAVQHFVLVETGLSQPCAQQLHVATVLRWRASIQRHIIHPKTQQDALEVVFHSSM